jgi:hypothetical protein
VRACSAYRGAFMRPCHDHWHALKCVCPIHSHAHRHGRTTNRRAHNACLCPPYRHPHAHLFGGQACTCACILPDRSHMWGPTRIKPPVRPSVQALPKNGNPNSMQDDQTTNLKLVGPRSNASSSRNLEISSEYFSSSHYSNKYK